jgi:hypothetical protein
MIIIKSPRNDSQTRHNYCWLTNQRHQRFRRTKNIYATVEKVVRKKLNISRDSARRLGNCRNKSNEVLHNPYAFHVTKNPPSIYDKISRASLFVRRLISIDMLCRTTMRSTRTNNFHIPERERNYRQKQQKRNHKLPNENIEFMNNF